MDIEAIKGEIAAFHQDKKWIFTPDVAAAATPMVDQLRDWGVDDLMIVAGVEGVGDLPNVDRIHYTRTSGETIMLAIRAFMASIESPSAELLKAVDAFDPGREAQVLGQMFSRQSHLAGRPVYGARPVEWRNLEDKTVVDELWDAVGIARVPADVVVIADAPAAAERLGGELGTVWAADNREGWHGGGEYTRWVREPADVEPAAEWFHQHAHSVRVMPFLDGLPCSIHGFVTGDGVSVFNPVELLIYRRVDRPGFFYAGGANFWEPPGIVRAHMREAARSLGSLLDERMGYRGGFGIDGIATAEGFRPTELNPRLSLGHLIHSRAADFPLGSVERMLIAGDIDIGAAGLEFALLDASQVRRGGAMFRLDSNVPDAKAGYTIDDDGVAHRVDPDEPNDGILRTGPAAFGTLMMISCDPDRTPVGPSIAPRMLAVVDLARDIWGVELPGLEPAPDLRS